MAPSLVAAAVGAACCAALGAGPRLAAGAPTSISVIDVPEVVCFGGKGYAEVTVSAVPGKAEEPHVISFYRNGKTSATVTFRLLDNSGREVWGSSSVALQSYAARRLAPEVPEAPELEPAENGCEDVFLVDGSDPVGLPDTWDEAREALTRLCELERADPGPCGAEVAELFRDTPAGGDAFVTSAAFCRRLRDGVRRWSPELAAGAGDAGDLPLSAAPRRAKGASSGGKTSSGGRVASFTKSSRVDGGYSYTSAGLAASYRGGSYSRTSYGYSGTATRLPGARAGTFAVLWWGSPGFRGSRWHTRCTEGESCSGSTVDCRPGTVCDWAADGDLIRDDLMLWGFVPSEHSQPFKLRVTRIVGSHYDESQVCPPWNWTLGDSWWQPMPGSDLFVALSDVEYVEEGLLWWHWLLIVLGSLVGLAILVGSAMWFYRSWKSNKEQQNASVDMAEWEQGTTFRCSTQSSLPDAVPLSNLAEACVSCQQPFGAASQSFCERCGAQRKAVALTNLARPSGGVVIGQPVLPGTLSNSPRPSAKE